MKLPAVRGVIQRRLLVNYRVDPDALLRAGLVPAPFRPQIVNGAAVAGICLIRLAAVRPSGVPARFGLSSENAAHRIAVEWDAEGDRRTGVFVPRRDTSSRLNALVGSRTFAGLYQHARFTVQEREGRYRVAMDSDDGSAHVLVDGVTATELPTGSIFRSLMEASAFFEQGSVGYSPGRAPGEFEALELRSAVWHVEPLAVEAVESSLFDDPDRFPAGTATFDSALLMRDVDHEWHAGETLCPSRSTPRNSESSAL